MDTSEPVKAAEKERIRRTILAHGFDRVGFAAAGPASGAERLRRWLERGHGATMTWLWTTAEARCDPRKVLRGARTVIVTAVHYPRPEASPSGTPAAPRGRISCYAGGDDYHAVLERRLRAVSRELSRLRPAAYRYYVDTGPVLEKDWAQASGVGWIGKNTCAIDAGKGSYFFLGVVLTTLEVEPDPPALDRCGSCSLCLQACPTSALVAPRELDARACLSFLTIESRDATPPELAAAAGDWIFGCDICQEVCPYNAGAPAEGDPDLAPRPENVRPLLEELALLEETTFRARFRRSPVLRARFRGLLRNVIGALANHGGPRAVDLLGRLSARDDVARDALLAVAVRSAIERQRR